MLREIFDNICFFKDGKSIRLFHGSKNGIDGDIDIERGKQRSDFGQGFYLGTEFDQAAAWASSGQNPVVYEYDFNLSNLRCVNIDNLAWGLFIAFNRKPYNFSDFKNCSLISNFIAQNCDVITGKIADDVLFTSLNNFLKNRMGHKIFFDCVSCINRGTQFLVKTEQAKKHIIKISEHIIYPESCIRFLEKNTELWRSAEEYVDRIIEDSINGFREQGRTFKNIINEIEKFDQSIIARELEKMAAQNIVSSKKETRRFRP